MPQNPRILILEDVSSDAILAERELRRFIKDAEFNIVDNENDYRKALEEFLPDLIISDYQLPLFNGLMALQIANEKVPDSPVIIFTGSMSEDIAVNCMRLGAADYVIKDHLKRLGPAAKNVLEQRKIRLEKAAALKLLESRETMYHLMFAGNPQPMLIYDSESLSILEVNRSAINLYGYSEKEFLSLTIKDIRPPEDIPDLLNVVEKPRNDYFTGREWRHLKKNGELLYVEIISHAIVFNNRPARHVLIKDITDRKKAEEEIRRSKERLVRDLSEKKKLISELVKAKIRAEESDRLKTAFLQNISHEIRTPLNAIVGFCAFLGDDNLNPEKRKYFLDIIDASSNQLLSIISGIISMASLETGQESIHEDECDLNGTLITIFEQFKVTKVNPKIEFTFKPEITAKDPVILVDKVKLMQVLVNLIGNAFKFTPEGSIRFGYHIKDKWIEFFVSDTGIGVDPSMHETIFKRFIQADNTPTRKYGGSGLGLAISKGFVELMGGKIKVQSEPAKGSLFTFTIPYKPV